MKVIPNLLLIAGTGRNTGKTTLACSIINKFSYNFQIIGLKISPHFHGGTDSLKTIVNDNNFNIYEETSTSTGKDSSLMLNVGAAKVFYIEVLDEYLKTAFEQFLNILPESYLLVCESPALRKYIQPGVFFIVDSERNKNKKKEVLQMRNVPNKWIDTGIEDISATVDSITIKDNTWKYSF